MKVSEGFFTKLAIAIRAVILGVALLGIESVWFQTGFWRDMFVQGDYWQVFNPILVAAIALGALFRHRFLPWFLLGLGVLAFVLNPGIDAGIITFCAGVLVLPKLRGYFSGPESLTERVLVTGKYLFLALFGVSLLTYLFYELPALRDSLKDTRHERRCKETKEAEPCGQHALYLLRSSRNKKEYDQGIKLLDAVCKRGNKSACRHAAEWGAPWYPNTPTWDDMYRRVTAMCDEGNVEACWVVADFAEGFPRIGFHRIIEVTKGPCEEGNKVACMARFRAERQLGIHGVPPAPTGLCKKDGRECCELAVSAREPGNPGCWRAGDDKVAEYLSKNVYLGIMSASRPSEAERVDRNREQFEGPCEDGDPLACVALLTSQEAVQKIDEPYNIPADLEEKLLKHCDEGRHITCLALALRYLDKPIDEEPDPRAEELVNKACDGGSAEACWWKEVFFETTPRLYELALERCIQSPESDSYPCWTAHSLILERLGLAYWRAGLAEQIRTREAQCQAGDQVSCDNFARVFDLKGRNRPPLLRRSYAAADKGCKMKRRRACETAKNLKQYKP